MLPRVVSMTAVAIRPHFRGSAASVGSLPTRPWSLPVSPLWRGAAHCGAQDGDWDNRAVLLVPFYRGDRVDDIGGRFDPWLLGVSIALACFGVVMVGSAAVAGAGMDVGPWYFLSKHAMFLAGGLVLAAIAMRTELKFIEQHSQLLLLACFAVLLLEEVATGK